MSSNYFDYVFAPLSNAERLRLHLSKALVGKEKSQSQSISHGLGQNIPSIRIRGCYFICNYAGLLVYK